MSDSQFDEICHNCTHYAPGDSAVCPDCGFDRKRKMVADELKFGDLFWHEYPAERNKKGDMLPPYDQAVISYWMVDAHWVHAHDLHVTIRRYPQSVRVSYSYAVGEWDNANYTYATDGAIEGIANRPKIFKMWLKTDRADFEMMFEAYMLELAAELQQAIAL